MSEEEPTIIISGVPADTPENRARLRELTDGEQGAPWPDACAGSGSSACERCGSEIWIGPVTQLTMAEILAAGGAVQVWCLFCCARRLGPGSSIVTLTEKPE